MFSKGGFDATKLKASLRLCSSRFDVAKNKKSALMKHNMREVATLLAEDPPKEEKARIRTERLIKDDYVIEAYEILQLECQLLTERVQLLKHSKGECPPDLVGCVSDLIYAAPRVEIVELQEIKKQLVAKFGKQFAMNADNNENGVVSQRIVEKLSLAPPTAYMVQTYMSKIAKLYEVDYDPTIQLTLEEAFEPVAAPVGFSVPVAQGTGLGSEVYQDPPANPYYGKGTTVVKALAYDPKYDTESLATTEVTSNTTSSAKPAATLPTAPEEDTKAKEEQYNVVTGVAPTESKATEDSSEAVGDSHTRQTEAEEEEEFIVEPRSEPTNPAFNPAAEQDNETVSYNITSDTVEVEAFPTDADPLAKVIPSDETITVHATAPEEDASITKKDLYAVETGFAVPVNKEEEHETPIELNRSKDSTEEVVKDQSEAAPSKLDLLRERLQFLGGAAVTHAHATPPPPSVEDNKTEDSLVVDRNMEQVDSPLADVEEEEAPANDLLQDCCKEDQETDQPVAKERSCDDIFLKDVVDDKHAEEDKENGTVGATLDRKAVEQEFELAVANDDDQHDPCKVKNDPIVAAERSLIVTPENDLVEEEEDKDTAASTVDRNDDEQVSRRSVAEPDAHHCEAKKGPLVVEEEEDGKKKKKKDTSSSGNVAEHITGAALAGGAVGFAVAGSLGGLLGAAGVAHLAANKKGKAADLARKCGKKVTKMTNKLVDKMERS